MKADGALVRAPETTPRYQGEACPQSETCDWLPVTFAALKRLIKEWVPKGKLRDDALIRIARLDPLNKSIDQNIDPPAGLWTGRTESSPNPDDYEKELSEILREIGCAAAEAPYVIDSLIPQLDTYSIPTTIERFRVASPYPATLAAAFLDERNVSEPTVSREALSAICRGLPLRCPRRGPQSRNHPFSSIAVSFSGSLSIG
jgi:hypothetical protein